jgi:molybdate transport system substrate-binding protein
MSRGWFAVALLTVGIPFVPLHVTSASAAEIKVLSAVAIQPALDDLVRKFERKSGHSIKVAYATAGIIRDRIQNGEEFDVGILPRSAFEPLLTAAKIVPGSATVVARSLVAVAVPAGSPKPDISTVDAFKRALLSAKTVAYIDPASGGSSGIYVAGLLDKLGIAEQIKPKARLKKGGHVADLIVSGDAELGIHQISEIVPVKEVTLVGPLPTEIQNYTVYAAALGANARDSEAAKALIKALGGPGAADLLKSKGMEPPGS